MDLSLSDLLTSVKEVATTGTQAYSAVVGTQTDKLKEKAAIEQAKPATVPPTASSVSGSATVKQPWYKAAWVIPSAIGGVLLIVVLFVAMRRKR